MFVKYKALALIVVFCLRHFLVPTETTEESIASEPIAKSDSVEEEVDSPTEEKEEKSTLISKKESNEEEDKPKDKKSDTTTSKVNAIIIFT